MSNASVLHSPPPAFASADYFYPSFLSTWCHKKNGTKGGGQKKSCNIVTTYVGRRTGNYNFIIFFHGPNSSKSAKKFFLLGGGGG